uniref:Uncharacterized protein n=1 Tax=Myoviridae sp. ctP6q2 TaxID=2825096 RepID=A0A8S5UUK6_9CAUD|nr:MAG TPA: hypothetical protein [Myoviridae sp. ctP6q2]DAH03896.1 MAG TPA: hypothetical protein [Caudoviricetes sp.]DAJ61433.1 MAG TPA: hypothetical protein [Caudoviricetes sp.]
MAKKYRMLYKKCWSFFNMGIFRVYKLEVYYFNLY